MKFLKIILFSLALPLFAESSIKDADSSSSWLYLNESTRKSYSVKEYDELTDPDKELRRAKLKFKFFYLGESVSHIDSLFTDDLSMERNMYLKLYSNTEAIDTDEVPIVISRRSRKKLVERMKKLEIGTEIVLYGALSKVKVSRAVKAKNKQLAKKGHYCFMVSDAYLGYLEELGFSDSKSSKDKQEDVDIGNLDLKLKSLLGRKISFTATYGKRNSQIVWNFKSNTDTYSNRKYMQIVCKDETLTYSYLLLNRKSKSSLDTLLKSKPGDKIKITATVKPSPGGRLERGEEYILLIDSIETPTKEQTMLRRNDVPESTVKEWEY